MLSSGTGDLISPLSLSNVLTLLAALICLWTMSPQAHGGVWRLWRLATPAAFAAVVALVLLSNVFDARWQHDIEWLTASALGGLAGRMRGWTLPVTTDQVWRLVRLPKAHDGLLASFGIVVMAALDFTSALLKKAVVDPQHIAAGAALCAGFIGCRALAIIAHATRAPHVGLHDG
jgi:hypothetical protein